MATALVFAGAFSLMEGNHCLLAFLCVLCGPLIVIQTGRFPTETTINPVVLLRMMKSLHATLISVAALMRCVTLLVRFHCSVSTKSHSVFFFATVVQFRPPLHMDS